MKLLLRTVVYAKKINVHNVPVYSCQYCEHSEIYCASKQQLLHIVKQVASETSQSTFNFQDVNEFAKLLYRSSSSDYDNNSVGEIIDLRVTELLDLLVLAESINDSNWVAEINERLDQISDYSRAMNEWN